MTEETHQTTEGRVQPELKQILGALLFASRKQISTGELRGILEQVAQNGEDGAHQFAKIKESDIRAALELVKAEIAERKLGIILVEVAGGFRLQTDPAGGPWVRQLLNLDKPAHLSKPALETLAIIAYRQPITRAEIEALRGVNVDAMMRHLLELQLIRIMGRSDLPGRPLMYGTTQLFLEHFGLNSVNNLPGIEQLSRRDAEHVRREKLAQASASAAQGGLPTDSSPVALAKGEASGAKAGGQTTDTGQQKTEEANADLSAEASSKEKASAKAEVPADAGDKAAKEPDRTEREESGNGEEDEEEEDDDEDDEDDDDDEEEDDEEEGDEEKQ